MSQQAEAARSNQESDRVSEEQTSENRHERERRSGSRHHRQRGHSRQQAPQSQSAKSSLNLIELREIAELIDQHGFTDFEFENENIRVRLRKELAPQIVQAAPVQQTIPFVATPQSQLMAPLTQTPKSELDSISNASAPASTVPFTTTADDDSSLRKIVSPIVGTFYRAPSPEAESFVKVGSQVSADTIVCIIEAMKLMNEIPAEVSGEIVEIFVENGQPVEYGQPLFAVK